MAWTFVTYSAVAIRAGMGPKGFPLVVHIQPRHDHTDTAIGQIIAHLYDFIVEKLRLVYAYHIAAICQNANIGCSREQVWREFDSDREK